MNIMEEIVKIRRCIKILANIKIYIIYQFDNSFTGKLRNNKYCLLEMNLKYDGILTCKFRGKLYISDSIQNLPRKFHSLLNSQLWQ